MTATICPADSFASSFRKNNGKRYAFSFVGSALLHLAALAVFTCGIMTREQPPRFAMESQRARIKVHFVSNAAPQIQTAAPVVPPSPRAPLVREAPDLTRKPPSLDTALLASVPRPLARSVGPSAPAARAWTPISASGGENTATQGSQDGKAESAADAVAKPDYLRNPPPPYPRMARERGWDGTTLLRVEVLANGTAGAIEIVRSSGHRLLDEASVQTVRGWRFHPARRNQRPINAWAEVPITFVLNKG